MKAMPEKKNNPISRRAKFKLMIKARNKRTMLCGVHNVIKPIIPPNAKPKLSCQGFHLNLKL